MPQQIGMEVFYSHPFLGPDEKVDEAILGEWLTGTGDEEGPDSRRRLPDPTIGHHRLACLGGQVDSDRFPVSTSTGGSRHCQWLPSGR